MYALGAFFDYNGTSSMGGKVNEEKWILVYIFIWAIHVISSYVDSCWGNTVFEHEKMDCLAGLWQVMAAVLSIVALLKYKKKEDRMLSVMSLIFAVVEGAFMSLVVIL